MKEYSLEEIRNYVRPTLGSEVPLVFFRILRVIGMRALLGESAGQTLYMMGKSVGNMLAPATMEDFDRIVRELKIGIPEIGIDDEDHKVVRLRECITCAGFPVTGEMFCDLESGIIAGLLEKVHGRKAKSTQTKSWSAGFDYCEFEVFLY